MNHITLKDYIKGLNEVLEDYPELADKPAIYASDDEGNSFHYIYCSPTPCIITHEQGSYIEIRMPADEEEDEDSGVINAVVIN